MNSSIQAAIFDLDGVIAFTDRYHYLAWKKMADYVELLKAINPDDLYPGAPELLRKLREAGFKIGLGSSSKNAMLVLDSLGLTDLFDVIVTGADITRAKPDPQIFLMGAKRLKVDPAHCVVFEDAPSGVAAALAAGMKCVGVGSADFLTEAPSTVTDYSTIDINLLRETGSVAAPAIA